MGKYHRIIGVERVIVGELQRSSRPASMLMHTCLYVTIEFNFKIILV